MGVIGFDIDDIAWTKANFEAEQAFVLNVMDEAGNETNWDVLAYQPNIKPKLLIFRELVEAYQKSFVESEEWGGTSFFKNGDEFQVCPIHKIYKHKSSKGCRICNTVFIR
jgi:hypothetical protein